ncbi:MAG: formylglycine-generating enzyme family protein [Thermoguttaceae bacterium]
MKQPTKTAKEGKADKTRKVGNNDGFALWFPVCAWILFIIVGILFYFRDSFTDKFIGQIGASTQYMVPSTGTEQADKPKDTLNTQSTALAALGKVAPMVKIPGGVYMMGNDLAGSSDQRPAHEVQLSPFEIDKFEVTNQQFRLFVEATGYKTTAETSGWSYVFDSKKKGWTKMPGANWETDRLISPAGSAGDDWLKLPVVHVSYIDALAFCDWAEKRLPTEAEWEYVARSGLIDADFSWGNQREPNGRYMANYWQGWFPTENADADGFHFLAPVGSFPISEYGVYDITGNAAEWCSDIYDENYYRRSPRENPQGPIPDDAELLSDENGEMIVSAADSFRSRVVRGGSYLSAENSDAAYKVFVRSKQLENLSYQNIGFRCVRDCDKK